MHLNLLQLRKAVLVVLCTIAISMVGFGQDFHRIDSLKNQLGRVSEKERIDVLRLISLSYGDADTLRTLEYSDLAYKLAINQRDTFRMVRTGLIKGIVLNRMERLDESLALNLYLLPMAKNHRYEYYMLSNSIGNAYNDRGEYDKALKYHFISLIEREAEGDKSEISISLNNIGVVYLRLESYARAIDYFTQSIRLRIENSYMYDLDRVYINLGLAYLRNGSISEARKNIFKGFEVCRGACSSSITAEGKYALGACSFEENNLIDAENYNNESLRLAESIASKEYQALNQISLARIQMKRYDYQKANENLLKAEENAKAIGFNQILIEVYEQFSILFDQIKNYEKASLYRNRYIQINDSIYSSELINNLAEIQSEFDERENTKIIAERDTLVALQSESIAKARQQSFFVVIIAVLIIGLAGLLFLFNKSQRKTTMALSAAKKTIEEQNAQLADSNKWLDRLVKEKTTELVETDKALVRANEERDQFIYKTSHDIRGPLATMKGMTNLAMMDAKDPIILDYLQKLDGTAGKLNIVLSRMLIVNQINQSEVNPEFIDLQRVVDDILLIENIRGVPARLEIRVDIDKDIVFRSDKELVKIILENLISNAIKFYNDSVRVDPFVEVRIKKIDSAIVLTVRDNGIGIVQADKEKIFKMFVRVSERSQTGGMGLYLSKLAAEKAEAKIDVNTTPEGYTEFAVVFPDDLAVVLEKRKQGFSKMSLLKDDSGKQNTLQAS